MALGPSVPMQPCRPYRAMTAACTVMRSRAVARATWWSCSSTASTGTCWGATAARSSTRRTSTASPASGRSGSRSHVTGSLPCMPARHDILCGSLDFLWRPWGSIELWEEPITQQLRRAGVTTMLVSDHPHLFEVGGENYHTDFSAWDYVRGHEGDPWRTYRDPSYIGAPALPARGGGWYWQDRHGGAGGRPALRPVPHVLPGRGGLPGAEDDAGRGRLAAPRRARRRTLPALRGRVRPARAVRHARAVGAGATTPAGRASCSSGLPTTSAPWPRGA